MGTSFSNPPVQSTVSTQQTLKRSDYVLHAAKQSKKRQGVLLRIGEPKSVSKDLSAHCLEAIKGNLSELAGAAYHILISTQTLTAGP